MWNQKNNIIYLIFLGLFNNTQSKLLVISFLIMYWSLTYLMKNLCLRELQVRCGHVFSPFSPFHSQMKICQLSVANRTEIYPGMRADDFTYATLGKEESA